VTLTRDVAYGEVVGWADVKTDAADETIKARRAMEAQFRSV